MFLPEKGKVVKNAFVFLFVLLIHPGDNSSSGSQLPLRVKNLF